ncbi:molecular chaperone DnaK [Sulfidibacter corallicola]|uniref:Chaperone protein DnaK n=1 Tax=Sulfidibacter corallicola TaxID=2818388 RepID=A0A8A4TRZ9_SULCO|nr:molecular chaperone DnaK [Sulfidibacter corallicola]QTD52749.1 molecular chaperone DnaK [Sulfidibacter corallicola]
MGKTIGIDLGTTNCCVAFSEAGTPKVLPNKEGSRTTPSVVAFTDTNERLIGHIAKRQAVTNPKNTIYAVKRLIGQKYNSQQLDSVREHLAYEVVAASNGDAWVKAHEDTYSPQEISGIILRELKESAEEFLGEEVTEAVITVPAYFDDAQRQATKDAGTIAGLEVKRIINEPTAAALAYGLESGFNGRVAVYDIGGGTFDVSVLEVQDGVFEVQSTSGDCFLGGEDFDNSIINWMIECFQEETGINLRFDKMALQRLKEAAEKAKCELSAVEVTEISLPFISSDATGAKHLNLKLEREVFNELIRELAERTRQPCLEAMSSAGITAPDVDRILLVGGQSRTPLIHEMVREIFSKEPTMDLNPDEVVGLGAALQGSILKGEVKDIVLLDVTPLSLGIETQGGLVYSMIEKNANIPTSYSQIFTTVTDNQSVVSVHILQGESDLAANNRSLAKFDLVDIPPAPRGVPQIEVTFEIDTNGIVKVSAVDLQSKREQSINISPSSGLSPGEIDEIIQRAETNKAADAKRKDFIRKMNKLESMIERLQKTFKEYGHFLSEAEKEKIHGHVADAEKAIKNENEGQIEKSFEEINKVSKVLSEAIMFGGHKTKDD